MLHEFDPLTTKLTIFVVVNWLALLASALWLLYIYCKRRYMFIKPSVLLLAYSHILFQWPLAIYSGYYEVWLPQPYGIVLLLHGYVLAGLAGSMFLFQDSAKRYWERVKAGVGLEQDRSFAIYALFGVVVLMATLYFSYVPLHCTGLYALVTSPDYFALAREISLKLLVDPAPRYSLQLLSSAVVPLMTGLVAMEFIRGKRAPNLQKLLFVALLLVAWLLADLNGAKSVMVYLALVVVAAIAWNRGLSIPILKLPFMLLMALAPAYGILYVIVASPLRGTPHDFSTCFQEVRLNSRESDTLITALEPANMAPTPLPPKKSEARSTELPTATVGPTFLESVYESMQRAYLKLEILTIEVSDAAAQFSYSMRRQIASIMNRALIAPFEVGGWYVHYFQTAGPMGFGAITRLANIFGLEVISGGNVIAQTYGPIYAGRPVPPSTNAGAGYLFSYFAYFGYWAIAINLALLFLTDIALWVFGRVADIFLTPLLATLSLATLKFLEADYSTVWLSHGFGVILALALALTALIRLTGRGGAPAAGAQSGA